MKFETLAIHAGRRIDSGTSAVMPPIILSTTFAREPDGSMPHGYEYTRSENPNRTALEECLAALEGGAAAAAFASGQAATLAVLQTLASADHVIIPDDVYFGMRELTQHVLGRWGLQATAVNMADLDAVRAAVRPATRLIWAETPSNPLLTITDIEGVAAIAHEAGATCVVDNTWASPVGQSPLQLGADLVMHATTKYLGGHSDLLGGAIITRQEDELFSALQTIQKAGGAVPSPFDCWLLLRSISTLPYRVAAHTANAQRVAAFLRDHRVVAAYYGLAGSPRPRGGGPADASIRRYDVDPGAGRRGRLSPWRDAAGCSHEPRAWAASSLIEHRATTEGPNSKAPQNLLRISVGLEHADDLIDDLAQALA